MARNKRFSTISAQVKKALSRAHKSQGNFTRFGGKPKAPKDWQAPIETEDDTKSMAEAERAFELLRESGSK